MGKIGKTTGIDAAASVSELPLMVLLVIVTCPEPNNPHTPTVSTPPAELPLTVVLRIVAVALPLQPSLLIPVPSLSLTLLLTTVRLAVPLTKALPALEIPSALLLLTTLSMVVIQAQPLLLGNGSKLKAPVPELLLMMLLATVMEAPSEPSPASLWSPVNGLPLRTQLLTDTCLADSKSHTDRL
jgi:hypothetical protein